MSDSHWLPRASGDTPQFFQCFVLLGRAAPRKWGYTRLFQHLFCADSGCPAQVGIHPSRRMPCSGGRRLPRASGDTPQSDVGIHDLTVAAPRKWGYTDVAACLARAGAGCPAQVGIHRVLRKEKPLPRRLPRASGDTPMFGFMWNRLWMAAPRKWGYTADHLSSAHETHGCPAQVGIHLVTK